MPPVRIAVFNVKYSRNLGDGVIAQCLEQEMTRRTGWTVCSVDLAGRRSWSHSTGGRGRAFMLRLLSSMPRWLRDTTVELVLGHHVRRRVAPMWRTTLKGADFAIFGGGQLFQDGDLNFPVKLAAAAGECERERLPMAVFAVGAAANKSPRGRMLMSRLLTSDHLVYVAARDPQSRDALLRLFSGPAEISPDPGLLASRTWPAAPRATHDRAVVGLGIVHPAVLNHHTSGGEVVSSGRILDCYCAIARSLVDAGFHVQCFTNGAGEDEMVLDALMPRLQDGGGMLGRVTSAPRSDTPRDLALMIAGCDAIAAHRLHAAILAYSYRVPAIGLLWDAKVAAFFELVGRSEFLSAFDQASVPLIARSVRKAIAEGVDPAVHESIMNETDHGIDRLVRVIEESVRAKAR
jgi:polysaccharide pyruvyl transferase WcaK-like protein